MATRLSQVRETTGLKPYPFSLKARIDSSQFNRAESGAALLGPEKLLGLLTEFNVNLNWLIGGQGEMFLGPVKQFDDTYHEAELQWRRERNALEDRNTQLREELNAMHENYETLNSKIEAVQDEIKSLKNKNK